MARIFGLNGVLRGRQGNNVFSVQNGTQVVKAYQPVVSNPRTIGQREQRAKFALAGKMSAATPTLAIVGLSAANPRAKRARFVSEVLRTASVSGSADALVASVGLADVLYSEGSVSQYRSGVTFTAAYSGGTVSRDNVLVTVQSGTLASNAPAGYGELRVVALYDAATSTLEEVQAKELTSQSAQIFTFRESARRDCFVAVYIVPFVRSSRLAAPIASGLAGSETAVSLDVDASSLMSGADFGHSVFIGSVGVLGGQANLAPSRDDDNRFVTDPVNGDVVKVTKKK